MARNTLRNGIIVVAGLLVLVASLWLWRTRQEPKRVTSGESDVADSMLRQRHAARGDAPVDTSPGELSGRVTRSDGGAGVPGAVVAVVSDTPGFVPTKPDEIIAVADSLGNWTAAKVPAGSYVVSATAPGLLPAQQSDVHLKPGESKTGLNFALSPGGIEVRGRVTDIGGGGIAGAKVDFELTKRANRGDRASFFTITNGDGEFRMNLAAGDYLRAARHDVYTTSYDEAHVSTSNTVFDFVLIPGGTIAGQVVRRDGTPVPEAILSTKATRQGAVTARSDHNGRFELRNVGSGAIEIFASGRGVVSLSPTEVELGIGEAVDGVTVVVDRGYTVSGFAVRKGSEREGVPGVNVGILQFSAQRTASALGPTDDDGYFEIEGVAPGSYIAFAASRQAVPEMGTRVEVAASDVKNLVLTIDSGVTLRGRVEPAGSASLSLAPAADGFEDIFAQAKAMMTNGRSGPDGTFELERAPTGSFQLIARSEDGRTGKLQVVIGTTDLAGLVVKLEQQASLAGKVVDAAGAPVQGARVSVDPGERGRFEESTEAVTGRDGSFRVTHITPGKNAIMVMGDGGQLAWADDRQKERPTPMVKDLARGENNVTLTIEVQDGVIRGRVVGEDKRAAPDVWVTATRLSDPHGTSTNFDATEDDNWASLDPVLTDGEGRFTLRKLRRGNYRIIADGEKGASRAIQSPVATSSATSRGEVLLTLARLGSLAGRVNAGGTPVASYKITCAGPRRLARTVGDPQGSYRFDRAPPGKYKCNVKSASGSATGEVTVAGGQATLDLSLQDLARVRGIVVDDQTGTPLAGLQVVVVDGGDPTAAFEAMMRSPQSTDASGRFAVDGVAAGDQLLFVLKGAEPVVAKPLQVKPGQLLDLGTIRGGALEDSQPD